MKTCIVGAVSVLIALNSVAGPIVPAEVSSKAKWAVHIDATSLRGTELGGHMLARMNSEDAQFKMDAFRAMVAFDPRTDLDGITLYGTSGDKAGGVALLHGRFDGEQLAVLVRANDSYASERYAGLTLHSWIGEKHGEPSFGCVVDDGTLVFSGKRDALAHAVDVLTGRALGLSADASLSDLMQIDARYFFSAAGHMAEMQEMNPRATILRNTDMAVIAVGEKDGTMQAAVEMRTSNAEAAINLGKMLDGMIGMAMLNEEGNPGMAAMARGTALSVEGSLLSMSIEMPVADIIEQMKKKQAANAKP